MGKRNDEGRPVMKGEIAGSRFSADDRQAAGHGLGRRVRPARPHLGPDVDVGLRKEPSHPVLRQIEIEIVGDFGFNQGARVAAVRSDQRVEKDEP